MDSTTTHQRTNAGHLRARRSLFGLLILAAIGVALAGCGISLQANDEGSEVFKDLTIEGDFLPGQELALSLEYEQPYPALLTVICDLLEEREGKPDGEAAGEGTSEDDSAQVIRRLVRQPVSANPAGGPLDEATPVPGAIERAFVGPDAPGKYIVVCFTDQDNDNAIAETINIRAAP